MIPFLSLSMPGQTASPPTSGKGNASGPAFEAIVSSMLPDDTASSLQPGLPDAQGVEASEGTTLVNTGHEIPAEARLDAGAVNQLPAHQGLGMFTVPAPTGESPEMPVADPEVIQQQVAPGQSSDAGLAGLVVAAPHAEQTVTKAGNADTEANGDLQPSGVHTPSRSVAPVIIPGHEATPTPGTIQPSAGNSIRETSTVSPRANATGAVTGENPVALSLPIGSGEQVAASPVDAAAVPTIVSGLVIGDARAPHGSLPVTATEAQVLTDPAVSLESPVPGAVATAPAGETPAALHPQAADPENTLATPVHGFPSTLTGAATPDTSPANKLGLDAVFGGKALAVESAVSRGPQELPLNRQLSGPIASLATGPHGDRTLSINIAPEALGPISVKAHLGPDGLRVELTAPTDAGRDALRAMLPELRRDLAATGTGTGTVSIGTATENGSNSGGANPDSATDQRFGAPGPAHQPRTRELAEVPLEGNTAATAAATQQSNHLDVMA